MNQRLTISIDNKPYICQQGETVLEVALRNKIDIPHLCYHEDLPLDANCRVCLVEADGHVVTSCTQKVEPNLKIKTNTREVERLRKINLELLFAGHQENCPKCKKGYFCKTAELMKKYGISGKKYSRPKTKRPVHKMSQAAEFDPNLCIACNLCVEMCEKIGINFLKLSGKAARTAVDYNKDKKVDCIYCGQCTVHCPVTAAREQNQIEQVEKVLKNKKLVTIAQCAPSIRCSIGEEFGLEPGINLMGQTNTALRKLGFDKIFDVNMGADITTYVEAQELAKRLKIDAKHGRHPAWENNSGFIPRSSSSSESVGGPMFTSCCPGWVKFAEFYHPEILPHLTTARSPQIHSGGAYKTWWAKKQGINPKKIVVVSIMPCTSKKYEARLKKLKIPARGWSASGGHGLWPVDYVLTTREFFILLKKNNINLPKLKKSQVDREGTFSGAGAIYGATGGVMESALRSAHYFITGKELKKVEFQKVRGMEKIKTAQVKIGKHTLKLAVAATAKYAEQIIQELKKNPRAYDYIEIMACPGGCIGGGGQPIPSTERIISQRIAGLYKIDDKMKLRKAHQNPIVKDFMENYIAKLPEKKQRQILHTSYSKKKKFE